MGAASTSIQLHQKVVCEPVTHWRAMRGIGGRVSGRPSRSLLVNHVAQMTTSCGHGFQPAGYRRFDRLGAALGAPPTAQATRPDVRLVGRSELWLVGYHVERVFGKRLAQQGIPGIRCARLKPHRAEARSRGQKPSD